MYAIGCAREQFECKISHAKQHKNVSAYHKKATFITRMLLMRAVWFALCVVLVFIISTIVMMMIMSIVAMTVRLALMVFPSNRICCHSTSNAVLSLQTCSPLYKRNLYFILFAALWLRHCALVCECARVPLILFTFFMSCQSALCSMSGCFCRVELCERQSRWRQNPAPERAKSGHKYFQEMLAQNTQPHNRLLAAHFSSVCLGCKD